MPDPSYTFSGRNEGISDPADSAEAITPDDVNPLSDIPRALYVGTGGNITMRGAGGSSDKVWKNVPSGVVLPFRARFVRATGTTAADILALY